MIDESEEAQIVMIDESEGEARIRERFGRLEYPNFMVDEERKDYITRGIFHKIHEISEQYVNSTRSVRQTMDITGYEYYILNSIKKRIDREKHLHSKKPWYDVLSEMRDNSLEVLEEAHIDIERHIKKMSTENLEQFTQEKNASREERKELLKAYDKLTDDYRKKIQDIRREEKIKNDIMKETEKLYEYLESEKFDSSLTVEKYQGKGYIISFHSIGFLNEFYLKIMLDYLEMGHLKIKSGANAVGAITDLSETDLEELNKKIANFNERYNQMKLERLQMEIKPERLQARINREVKETEEEFAKKRCEIDNRTVGHGMKMIDVIVEEEVEKWRLARQKEEQDARTAARMNAQKPWYACLIPSCFR